MASIIDEKCDLKRNQHGYPHQRRIGMTFGSRPGATMDLAASGRRRGFQPGRHGFGPRRHSN